MVKCSSLTLAGWRHIEILTSKILCDQGSDLIANDFNLTTVSAAQEAVSAAQEAISAATSTVVNAVVDMAIKKIQPLPHHIPVDMYNEMLLYQVRVEAESMGFTVTSNNSMIDYTVTHFSQYFISRPDLIIHHKRELLAYVVRPTEPDKEPDEELDEEPDKEPDKAQHVTLTAGVSENKLKVLYWTVVGCDGQNCRTHGTQTFKEAYSHSRKVN